MDPNVFTLARFLHIASVAVLVGGALCLRFVARGPIAAWSRPVVLTVILTALAGGLVNLITKAGLPSSYWTLFGVKFLLALHIFAVSLVLTKPDVDPAKRTRLLTGIAISGLVVILLSAFLRSMSLNA